MEVAGHDIKLGRGGIRRSSSSPRPSSSSGAGAIPRSGSAILRCAARAGPQGAARIDREQPADPGLSVSPRLENRLQMIDDQQTHALPEDEAELERVALLMGMRAGRRSRRRCWRSCAPSSRPYAVLFEKTPDLSGPGNLVFTGADDDPETLETWRGWASGSPAGSPSASACGITGATPRPAGARARELLTELIPTVLETLSTTNDPDAALLRSTTSCGRFRPGCISFPCSPTTRPCSGCLPGSWEARRGWRTGSAVTRSCWKACCNPVRWTSTPAATGSSPTSSGRSGRRITTRKC